MNNIFLFLEVCIKDIDWEYGTDFYSIYEKWEEKFDESDTYPSLADEWKESILFPMPAEFYNLAAAIINAHIVSKELDKLNKIKRILDA